MASRRSKVFRDTSRGFLVSTNAAKRLGISVCLPSSLILRGPSSEILRNTGSTTVQLGLAGDRVSIKCIVVDGLACDMVLGTPFMREHKAVVDFVQQTLELEVENRRLGRIEIPMVQTPQNLVSMVETFILPATVKMVKVRVPDVDAEMIEIVGKDVNGIGPVGGITSLKGLQCVLVANTTTEPFHIKPGMRVCEVRDVDIEEVEAVSEIGDVEVPATTEFVKN